MGTDYRIKICRNVDNKLIAICNANQLKSILDSEHSKIIHCDGRNCNNVRFTPNELERVAQTAFEKFKISIGRSTRKICLLRLRKTVKSSMNSMKIQSTSKKPLKSRRGSYLRHMRLKESSIAQSKIFGIKTTRSRHMNITVQIYRKRKVNMQMAKSINIIRQSGQMTYIA